MPKRKEEVKDQVKKEVKKLALLDIINALKEGKRPSHISKDLNISKQLLSYHMRKLKDLGHIKRIGYGVWEVKETSKGLGKDTLEVRGHAFMWKVRIPNLKNWRKRIEVLEKHKIKHKLIGAYKKTPRIIINDRKIWLGDKYLIIYEPKSFMGKTAIESQKFAVSGLMEVIEALENKFKVSFKIKGKYNFKVRRHHYALIKNLIARQFDREGKKLMVFHKGDLWFLIDNSYNLQEAETVHKKTAVIDNMGFQNYMNSHKETNFEVTPTFVLKMMKGIQQNQLHFAENMRSHVEAVQELGASVRELTKKVKELGK